MKINGNQTIQGQYGLSGGAKQSLQGKVTVRPDPQSPTMLKRSTGPTPNATQGSDPRGISTFARGVLGF